MQRIDFILSVPLYFCLGSCGGEAHDHAHDHDHDHGTGEETQETQETQEPQEVQEVQEEETSGHAHVHAAPHGGTLNSIGGGGANIEVLLDGEQGQLTFYLFDGCAENSLRSDLESMTFTSAGESFQLAAIASGLSGETVGDTSEFGVTDERLKGRKSLSGILSRVSLLGSTLTDVPIQFTAADHND